MLSPGECTKEGWEMSAASESVKNKRGGGGGWGAAAATATAAGRAIVAVHLEVEG